MALREYNIDEFLFYRDGKCNAGKIVKRYSLNPGGPLTYYDVVNGDDKETVHVSQITGYVDDTGEVVWTVPRKVQGPTKVYSESPVKSIREEVLDEAKQIVTKDRNSSYGNPEDNFKDIAEMWTTYIGVKFHAHDVAAMMAMVKLSRIKTSPEARDHWVDLAGYSACGYQAYSVTMDEQL